MGGGVAEVGTTDGDSSCLCVPSLGDKCRSGRLAEIYWEDAFLFPPIVLSQYFYFCLSWGGLSGHSIGRLLILGRE